MKATFFPKTSLGKWVVGLSIGFLIFIGVFFLLVEMGERGGDTIFSNLKLTIPYFIAVFSAIASFFIGFNASFQDRKKNQRENSILVYLCMVLGFLVLL